MIHNRSTYVIKYVNDKFILLFHIKYFYYIFIIVIIIKLSRNKQYVV